MAEMSTMDVTPFSAVYRATSPLRSQVKVSLLNFTITIKGLEEQLLNTAVKEELPDLAQKKVPLSLPELVVFLTVQRHAIFLLGRGSVAWHLLVRIVVRLSEWARYVHPAPHTYTKSDGCQA